MLLSNLVTFSLIDVFSVGNGSFVVKENRFLDGRDFVGGVDDLVVVEDDLVVDDDDGDLLDTAFVVFVTLLDVNDDLLDVNAVFVVVVNFVGREDDLVVCKDVVDDLIVGNNSLFNSSVTCNGNLIK